MFFIEQHVIDADGKRDERLGPYHTIEAAAAGAVEAWKAGRGRLAFTFGQRAFWRDADGTETDKPELMKAIAGEIARLVEEQRYTNALDAWQAQSLVHRGPAAAPVTGAVA